MKRRSYLLLFGLGLAVQLTVASFQTIPGYLDADYYFMGGKQLAEGKGFNEPFIWNYLDNPAGLPHPSHAYWMPLASLVTAAGMLLTGQTTYQAGRLGFILLAALVPPLTTHLAFRYSKKTALAWTSGLLAVFPIFHTAFLPVPDNYGIYMLAGGLYFLAAGRKGSAFWLGLLSGILTLARTDGLLWLGLTILFLLLRGRDGQNHPGGIIRQAIFALAGFLLVMGPWYLRNLSVYGALMSPSGSRALWLTNYEETFVYPASSLNVHSWWATGWKAILKVRLWSLENNLQTMMAAQGGLILFPFILIGMWLERRERRVQIAFLAWVSLLVVMSVVFPFAGARGSFFHAGAALQPFFWTLAPIGLDAVVAWARRHGRFTPEAFVVFRAALVMVAAILSCWVVWVRVIQPGWEEGELVYPAVESFLIQKGVPADVPIIALSAPGYTMMTGRPAYAQPATNVEGLLDLARHYGLHYFAFEAQGRLEPLRDLYDNPQDYPRFEYLGEVNEIRIYRIP